LLLNGRPQALLQALRCVSDGKVNWRSLRLHIAPRTASTFGPKSKSRSARLVVRLNTVKATGLSTRLRQLELRFSLRTGAPCAFQGLNSTRLRAGSTVGGCGSCPTSWPPPVCTGQLNLLVALIRPNAKVRDHKAHWDTANRDTTALRQFCHWPCRTFSPAKCVVVMLASTRVPQDFRQLSFKNGATAADVAVLT